MDAKENVFDCAGRCQARRADGARCEQAWICYDSTQGVFVCAEHKAPAFVNAAPQGRWSTINGHEKEAA